MWRTIAILAACFPAATVGFAPTATIGHRLFPIASPLYAVCDEPVVDSASILNTKGGANLIRDAQVTSADGQLVRLGDQLDDDGVGLVVFLRHLA